MNRIKAGMQAGAALGIAIVAVGAAGLLWRVFAWSAGL